VAPIHGPATFSRRGEYDAVQANTTRKKDIPMRVKSELWVIPFLIAGCASGEADAGAPAAPAPAAAAAPSPAPAAAAPAPAAAGGAMSVWDGVYTAEQAARGEEVASTVCFACHSQSEWTRPLFLGAWNGRAVAGLWGLIEDTMPYDSPGGLTDQEYTDVISYMMELNGMPAGTTELPAEEAALAQIMFAPRP
jgi:mono/diheme cytochrome c family protein